jgi:hypothetical protein
MIHQYNLHIQELPAAYTTHIEGLRASFENFTDTYSKQAPDLTYHCNKGCHHIQITRSHGSELIALLKAQAQFVRNGLKC